MEPRDFDLSRRFDARVLSTEPLTEPGQPEVRHIRFGTSLAVGSIHAGQLVAVNLSSGAGDSHFRLYSVAEIAPGDPGRAGADIALCVRRIVRDRQHPALTSTGLASTFLCDLQPGNALQLLGPYGHPFPIPKNETAPLIMIGAGTGIAPFRAFVNRIYAERGGWRGPVRLFHGARTGLEWLYQNDRRNDFAQYYDEHTFRAIQVVRGYSYARSVPDDLKLSVHVQEARTLLDHPHSHVYVAGTRALEQELERLLRVEFGREEWTRRKQAMVEADRWIQMLY